jgi:membrane protease YdiL (CAAX protease family)
MAAMNESLDRAVSSSKPVAIVHVVAYCLAFLPFFILVSSVDDAIASFAPAWMGTVVQAGFYLGGVVAVTWAFCRFLHRGSLADLGLRRQDWVRNLLGGWGLAAFLVGLVFVAYIAAGWLTVDGIVAQPQDFFIIGLFWIASSTVEEITTRGYIMQRLAPAWGWPAAVAVSSVIFTLPHALNPSVNLLALGNTFLIGMFFAFGYLATRSLWLPIGMHVGWNLVEIGLGFPDSGYVDPGILRSTVRGPFLITGGAYGPEAGLLVSGIALLGIAAMVLLRRRKALAGRRLED